MNEEERKHLDDIKGRLTAHKTASGYCDVRQARQSLEAHAPIDVEFLVGMVDRLQPLHMPGLIRQFDEQKDKQRP